MAQKMNNTLCRRCGKEPAIIHPRFGVTDGEKCKAKDRAIREHTEFATISQHTRITDQRDHALGDIAQPWNEDGSINEVFVKANTREDLEDYFTKEQLDEGGF